MTLIVVTFLAVVAILLAAIAGLLVQRTRRGRTERELRERAERLLLIVEQTPAMMWTMRPDSTLDFLNRTCTTFSGVPILKLLNDGWLDADILMTVIAVSASMSRQSRHAGRFSWSTACATLTAATDGC